MKPLVCCAMCLLPLLDAFAADLSPVEADVLLKNGTLYDGAGGEPVVGDVAILKDRIVSVGTFKAARANHTIDCTGLFVVPGFIDLHNHSDRPIVDKLTRANLNYLTQGCTTIVTGNCGSGPVDAADYYRKVDDLGAGTNVAHLLPQGSLRDDVMGTAHRAATAAELDRMRGLAAKAMTDGAWGMSTGLIYVPSSYADTSELIELARVISRNGGIYASHIRGEGTELLASVDEALKIGREAKLPVHVSHFKSSGKDAFGLIARAIDRIEAARKEGQAVTADQYPYVASSTSLEATLIPTWARAGGQPELLRRLDDPEAGPKVRDEMQKRLDLADGGQRLRIARYAPEPAWAGRTLASIAADARRTPLETAIAITRGGGCGIVNFNMDEDDVRLAMALPWVATASDGRASVSGPDRPHPRSYGTFSRKIGIYALRDNVIPVAQAIRSASGLPADILGMKDRGYLKAGQFADVVVFDPATYRDAATFEKPHQFSEGVRHVYVNGVPAIADGQPTGALAGRALRRAIAREGDRQGSDGSR